MVTKEIQKESSYDFSDALVASRELQKKGVKIDNEDISVEKKILVRDCRSRINLSTEESEEIDDYSITSEEVKQTLDLDRRYSALRTSSISGLIDFQDLKSDRKSRTKGVVVERNGDDYVYPVRVIYTVQIEPSDPIIEQEYYIEADSETEAKDIKNDIIESKESYVESKDTDVVVKTTDEVRDEEDQFFNYAFCFLMGNVTVTEIGSKRQEKRYETVEKQQQVYHH